MLKNKTASATLAVAMAGLFGSFSANTQAATASIDPTTGLVKLPVTEVLSSHGSSSYSVDLRIVTGAGGQLELELANVAPVANQTGQRDVFDSATGSLHIPAIELGGVEYYAKLKIIPGSSPVRFSLDQVVSNEFTGCPSFSSAGPIEGSCVLEGEIKQNVTLTKNIDWIVSGGVYVGGDNTDNAVLTVNPGTLIFGQDGADFLWIRRGSKIMAEGTPDNPIVMSGAAQQAAGEWGGLVIAGNAPVNGCNESVEVCEVVFEAITTETFGGNNPADNSGVLKYTQILFAGFQVRPDEELNGLTMNGVGSSTLVDYVHVHAGLDDGVEMFGGTVQMKHMVLSHIGDDSLDWGIGWTGKAQYVFIEQAADDGDRGIEADNNKSTDLEPRSLPTLANMTLIGSSAGSQGALLRRGTGAKIYNSVFTGFGSACLKIDGEGTYTNAGAPGALSGDLTIMHSYVDCATNFSDGDGATFAVSDWFNTQMANVAGDPQLNGAFPAATSPLLTGGMALDDAFFDQVDYIGAFKDANDDWTQEWTFDY